MDSFEKLQQLVSIYTIQKFNVISLFFASHSIPKEKQLFNLVKANTIESDTVSELKYESSKSSAYLKLKDRLIKKLENGLYYFEPSKGVSPIGSVYIKLIKRQYQYRVYAITNNSQLIQQSLERDIFTALKYGFNNIVIQLCNYAIDNFGFITPNIKKLNYYTSMSETAFLDMKAEFTVRKAYAFISHYALVKRKESDTIINLYNNLETKLKSYQVVNPSYFFILQLYDIRVYVFSLRNDNDKIISVSKRLEVEAINREYYTDLLAYKLETNKINALLSLKRYDDAVNQLSEKLLSLKFSDFNLTKAKTLEFKTYILGKKYELAYNVAEWCYKNKSIAKYPSKYQLWTINYFYMRFLLAADGQIDPKELRLGKFMNEVPLYSKDKRGFNVSVLICQMLFFLIKKKFNPFIDRMDALRQYSFRYLKSDDTLRSNCFIKMLLKLPDVGFHPVRAQAHVKKEYKKLKSSEYPVDQNLTTIEVIPYEELWRIILELMAKQKNVA